MTRKKLTLADQLEHCDPSAPYAGEVWADAEPVGCEFGARASPAATPLERLRGSVRRDDDVPTDPVWPSNDEPS